MSGQLGDSRKMPQPSPVSPKKDSSTKHVLKKTEPTPEESAPISAPLKATSTGPSTKANMEPTAIKPGTTLSHEEIKAGTTSVSPAAIDLSNTALVSTPGANLNSVTTPKETAPKPQVAVQNVDIPIVAKPEIKDPNMTKLPKIEVLKLTAEATHSTVTEDADVPPSTGAAKVDLAGAVQSTLKQMELSTQDSITKEAQPDDRIPETQKTKSSHQVEMQLSLQEPHLEAKPETLAVGKDRSSNQAQDVGIIVSKETTERIVVKVRSCL